MKNSILINISLLLFITPASFVASGQTLFKCVSPSGRVEYREVRCEGNSREHPIINGTVSGIDAIPEREIRRTMQAIRESAQVLPSQSTGGRNIPSEIDIQNMETSASSITLSKSEREARRAEIQAARYARQQAGNVPSETEIRNMETSASSISLSKREVMIRQAEIQAARNVRAGGSGEIDLGQVRSEDARVAMRRQAAAQTAAQTAATQAAAAARNSEITFDHIRNCTTASCRGQSGDDYSRLPAGGYQRRDDGKRCSYRNGQMTCF